MLFGYFNSCRPFSIIIAVQIKSRKTNLWGLYQESLFRVIIEAKMKKKISSAINLYHVKRLHQIEYQNSLLENAPIFSNGTFFWNFCFFLWANQFKNFCLKGKFEQVGCSVNQFYAVFISIVIVTKQKPMPKHLKGNLVEFSSNVFLILNFFISFAWTFYQIVDVFAAIFRRFQVNIKLKSIVSFKRNNAKLLWQVFERQFTDKSSEKTKNFGTYTHFTYCSLMIFCVPKKFWFRFMNLKNFFWKKSWFNFI